MSMQKLLHAKYILLFRTFKYSTFQQLASTVQSWRCDTAACRGLSTHHQTCISQCTIRQLSPVWQMRKMWILSNLLCTGYHQLHRVIHFRKTYLTDVYPNMMLWKNRATACGNGSNRYVQFVGNDPPNDLGVNLIHSTCRNWFPSKSATAGDFQCSTERLHGIFPSLASISYPNMRFSVELSKIFDFQPEIPGEMIQFDEHILKMGGSTTKHGNPCHFKSTFGSYREFA